MDVSLSRASRSATSSSSGTPSNSDSSGVGDSSRRRDPAADMTVCYKPEGGDESVVTELLNS